MIHSSSAEMWILVDETSASCATNTRIDQSSRNQIISPISSEHFNMDFVTLIHRFRILFSLCGLGEFSPRSKVSPTWRTRLSYILPAIVYLFVVIVLYCFAMYFRTFYPDSTATVNNACAYLHVSCEFLLHLTITVQALFHNDHSNQVFRSYESIQKYMLKRLNYRVDFKIFEKRLVCVFFVLSVPCMALLGWRLLVTLREPTAEFNLLSITLYFLSSVVQLYIVVHVELLKFFVDTTSQWLQARASEVSANNFHLPHDVLRIENQQSVVLHLKWIHFKLWEISINFNRIFGMSLSALILRNAVEIAFGVYGFFLYERMKYSYKTLIRKNTQEKIASDYINMYHFLCRMFCE